MILINDREITIDEIKFTIPYKIEQNKEYVLLEDRIIIVFDIDDGKRKNNLACYSLKGELLWTVKTPSKKIDNLNRDYLFVGISIIDDSCRVSDYWGRNFLVNINTGELSDLIWVR